MRNLIGLFALAVAFQLAVHAAVEGGAKEGKVRWSHKKTGVCKCQPPIAVPGAKENQPGIVTVKMVFKAKELAEFFVIGDGDSDIDLVVKDAKGNVVARDVDPSKEKGGGSDLCVCRWTPDEEQEFTIIIINNEPTVNVCLAGCN
ncbi:MAG: hypothetical protein L0215_01455 [Gemmataceae bacterium]|nr:hypothetical protein [Gemmataceae bacterium]